MEKNLITVSIYDFFLAISESEYLFSWFFSIQKLSTSNKTDDILYFALYWKVSTRSLPITKCTNFSKI